MKPIQQAFKLAQATACLANEWRDTIGYALLTAYEVHQALSGGGSILALGDFLGFVGLREGPRFVAWVMPQRQLRVEGRRAKPVDRYGNCYASAFVASGAFFLDSALNYSGSTSAICENILRVLAVSSLGALVYGKNPKDIPSQYFHEASGMWDWPRKNKDGGITQTQKLIDGFADLGRKLSGLLPSPPAPVGGRLIPCSARREPK